MNAAIPIVHRHAVGVDTSGAHEVIHFGEVEAHGFAVLAGDVAAVGKDGFTAFETVACISASASSTIMSASPCNRSMPAFRPHRL